MIKLSKRTNFKSERSQSNVSHLKKYLSSTHWTFIPSVYPKSKRKTSIGPALIAMAKNYTIKITTIKSSIVKLTNSCIQSTQQWNNNDKSKSNCYKRNSMQSTKKLKTKKHKRHVWPKWEISFTTKLKSCEKNWPNVGTRVTTSDGKSTTREEHILSTQPITRFWTVLMLLMKTTCCYSNKWASYLEDSTKYSWLSCPKPNTPVSNCPSKLKNSHKTHKPNKKPLRNRFAVYAMIRSIKVSISPFSSVNMFIIAIVLRTGLSNRKIVPSAKRKLSSMSFTLRKIHKQKK